MENKMTIFDNNEFGSIRTTVINNEIMFVGKDVAEILGYNNTAKAIRDHVEEEDKGVNKIFTPGGIQNLVFINESGLYNLILSSKMPNAKKFKHWVTSDVLPEIRKTGAYHNPVSKLELSTDFEKKIEQLNVDLNSDGLKGMITRKVLEDFIDGKTGRSELATTCIYANEKKMLTYIAEEVGLTDMNCLHKMFRFAIDNMTEEDFK